MELKIYRLAYISILFVSSNIFYVCDFFEIGRVTLTGAVVNIGWDSIPIIKPDVIPVLELKIIGLRSPYSKSRGWASNEH